MVQEDLISDLEVLDYLELFNSTVDCARLLGISQSSCSRRYRNFSERFGLEFDRIADRYQPTSNFDVLHGLRQASQKLRVRQGQPRHCLGWQLGELPLNVFESFGKVLPIRPMNSWRVLSMLEQRLVDVSIMGVMEFQGLLGHPLQRLRARRMQLSQTMMCLPIGRWELRVMAHHQHPLQGRNDITPEDLAQYPSPALPLGSAPLLMGALQSHGLASQTRGLSDYSEELWEGFAGDGIGLSYAAPNQIRNLGVKYQLRPLDYALGIQEYIGIVGHRDVLSDSSFPVLFKHYMNQLQLVLGPYSSSIHWLS